MKRGTPEHPKMLALARALNVPVYSAVGIMEYIWHWTAKYAPLGDIGRFENADIAHGIGWEKSPDDLINALVGCHWLDAADNGRLIVHDWSEHADGGVQKFVRRQGKVFANAKGTPKNIKPSIYFIQAAKSKAIKIGFTETSLESRLEALQTGSPEKLSILGTIRGTLREELDLHKRFSASALNGEWFKATPEILEFIGSHCPPLAANGSHCPPLAANGVLPFALCPLPLALCPLPLAPCPGPSTTTDSCSSEQPLERESDEKTACVDKKSKKKKSPVVITPEIEALYQAYPRHVGKQGAFKAIAKALISCSFAALMPKVVAFAASPAGRAGQYTPHPATWFNAGRWEDDPETWQRRGDDSNETQEFKVPFLPGTDEDIARLKAAADEEALAHG